MYPCRFEIMLQLLLMKLYDENVHPLGSNSNEKMDIQDLTNISIRRSRGQGAHLETMLRRARCASTGPTFRDVLYAEIAFACPGSTLRSLTALLANCSVSQHPARFIVQDFYMYFASRQVYKWESGPILHPYGSSLTSLSPSSVNLRSQPVSTCKDPACGSGDFLTFGLSICREAQWSESAGQRMGGRPQF